MEGSAFHLVLEKFYQKKMGLKKGLHILDEVEKELTEHLKLVGHQDQQDKFFTRINSLRAVIDRYYHHILAPDSKRFDVEEVELPVEMFINKGKSNELHVRGFVDAIWKDKKTGRRYIVEHKYLADFHAEIIPFDLQSAIYTMSLLEKYGPLPTIYNVARKSMMRWNPEKEGKEEFVTRLKGKMDKELEDFTWKATNYKSRYFVRQVFSRSRKELQIALASLNSIGKAMAGVEKNPETVYRNSGANCLYFCGFRDLCLEEDPLVIGDRFRLRDPKRGNRDGNNEIKSIIV